MAESGDLEDGDLDFPEEVDDEEGLIRYYFFKRLRVQRNSFVSVKNHGIEMSLSTLKRQIKQYGLRRLQIGL